MADPAQPGMPPSAPTNAKPPVNSKKAMVINICAIVGVVVSLMAMFGLGISGAIPGALFGGIGGGLGGLVGMGIAAVVVRD